MFQLLLLDHNLSLVLLQVASRLQDQIEMGTDEDEEDEELIHTPSRDNDLDTLSQSSGEASDVDIFA